MAMFPHLVVPRIGVVARLFYTLPRELKTLWNFFLY
jgi:hypothetical protein